MATEKSAPGPKVFDVAKPGSGKTDIGSKPMIVGHKTLAEDPMVREAEKKTAESPEETSQKSTKLQSPSENKKVITPLTDTVENDTKDEETEDVQKTDLDQKVSEEAVSDKQEDNDSVVIQDTVEQNEEVELDPNVEKMEMDDKLSKIIESKKYFVTVHDSPTSFSIKAFILTFVIALIVGLSAVVILIDAELLNIGVELPFDFL